jgi:hypothetical protein
MPVTDARFGRAASCDERGERQRRGKEERRGKKRKEKKRKNQKEDKNYTASNLSIKS